MQPVVPQSPVILSGGEPLMHNDLRTLCAFFRELDIRLTLLTTGLLLTKRAAEVAEWFDDVIVSGFRLGGPWPHYDDAGKWCDCVSYE